MNRSRLSNLIEIRTVKPTATRRSVKIFRQYKNPEPHVQPAIEISVDVAQSGDDKEGISFPAQSPPSADETKSDFSYFLPNLSSTQQSARSVIEDEVGMGMDSRAELNHFTPETSASGVSSQSTVDNPSSIDGLPAEMLMQSISESVKVDTARSTLKRTRPKKLSAVSDRPVINGDDHDYLNENTPRFEGDIYLVGNSLPPVHSGVQELPLQLPGRGHSIMSYAAKAKLIGLVKQQEIIWNKQCDHSFDSIGRHKRDLAWLSIAEEMQLNDVDSLKACWKRMSTYCKEMEQIKQKQNREPVWDLWEHLQFLRCPSALKTKPKCSNERPPEKLARLNFSQRKKLIKAIKCQPAIWDVVNCAGYHDDRKDHAWEAVGDVMSLSVAHCKDAWMRLRSNFSHRYKHRRLKLLQTGVAPEELPKPSSAHYDDLEFLTEVIDFTQKHEDLKPPAVLVSFNSSLRSALIKEVEKYPTIWKSDQSTKQSDEYWNMVSKTMAIPKEQLKKQWGRLRNYCLRLIHLEQHPKVRKRRRVFPPWEHWTEMTFFRDFVKKESPKSLSKTIRKQNLDDEPTASTSAEPDHKEANSTTIRKSIRIAKKKSRSYAADSNGSDNESFSLEGADSVQETHSNNADFIRSFEEPISTETSSEFSSRPQPVTPKSKKRVSARSTICKGFSLADRQKLIEYVKESEVIWNEDYDDARRSRLVGAAWRAIGQMLDKSALDCRNQWWRLRATFKGRLKLYETKKNSESNSNSSPAAEPKWVHWKEMQFIRQHWCKTIQSIEELPSDSRQTAVLCHSCGVYVDGASDSEPLVHILKKHFQKPQYRCQHCDFVAKQTFAEMQKHMYSTHVEHYEPSGDRTKPALLQAALTEVQHTCFPDYPRILQLSSARSAIISLMSTMLKSAESKKIIHRNVPMD